MPTIRASIVFAREGDALLDQQPDEPPCDVAEADEHEVERHRGAVRSAARGDAPAPAQVFRSVTESDAEIPVHTEVIAGHDQDAVLLPQLARRDRSN